MANSPIKAAALPTTDKKNASLGGTCPFSTRRSRSAARYSEMMIAMKRSRNTSAVTPSIQRSNNVRITPARIGATLVLPGAAALAKLLVLFVNFDVDGFLFRLAGARAECFVGDGAAGGKNAHLLLQLNEKHLSRLISARRLESLEVAGELVAGEFFLDLGARPDLALVRLDLLFHSREGFEGRLLRDVRHRLVDASLRVGTTLLGEQQILLAIGLFDVVVEAAERILETICLLFVGLPGQIELVPARDVFAATNERLLGEVVLILLHCEHRSALPVLGFLQLLAGLILEALLVGNGG